MAKPYPVCKASELPEGSRRIEEIKGISVGIFNVKGTFYALRNLCPHQLAPLCVGKITGTNEPGPVGVYNWCREGEIVRCPWHGWEFDITTGRSIFNPHKVRAKSYKVTVETAEGLRQEERSSDEEDPSVETYPVTVEEGMITVHL